MVPAKDVSTQAPRHRSSVPHHACATKSHQALSSAEPRANVYQSSARTPTTHPIILTPQSPRPTQSTSRQRGPPGRPDALPPVRSIAWAAWSTEPPDRLGVFFFSLSLSASFFLSLWLSVALSFFWFPSVFFCVSKFLAVSQSLLVFLLWSLFEFFSLSLFVSFCLSLFLLSVSLSVPPCFSRFVSLRVSLFLSVSIGVNLFLCVSTCLCLGLSVLTPRTVQKVVTSVHAEVCHRTWWEGWRCACATQRAPSDHAGRPLISPIKQFLTLPCQED